MRVLQVNNFHYLRGGSDKYFLEITRLLREFGHDARTFSSARNDNINKEFFAVSPVTGADTERAGGVSNIVRFLYSSEARVGMVNALRDFSPDIVHLHIYYGQLTASILKPLRDSGIPVVQTLHEYKLVCPTHGLYASGKYCDACQGRHYWHAPLQRCNRGSLARSLLSMTEAYVSDALGAKTTVDRYIAVSEYQKHQLVGLGVPADTITVLHNFTAVVDTPPEFPGDYFLFVGRILKEKGVGVLLHAYAQLGNGALPLKIVGTGSDMDEWFALADSLGIAARVEWLGYKSGYELEQLYRGSRVVINPSLLNETFGLTCLEAGAHGRPVIASRVGAFPEIIDDHINGFLVDPESVSGLAAAMRSLQQDQAAAFNMGKAGWEKAMRFFSASHHAEQLIEIYNEVRR